VTAEPIGLLVMAYGTANGPGDIERYYTDIRGGRTPAPEHLQELADRYAAIGNVFPLLDTTAAQAEGTAEVLNRDAPGRFRPYLGMKHSPPFVADAVADMVRDGVRRAVGIVMAPHWSGMSVETYIERARSALEELGAAGELELSFVRSYHAHPAFVELLAGRVAEALDLLPAGDREEAAVVFSAHSLPVRTVADGTLRCKACDCDTSCRYRDGLQETADQVADRLGLRHATIGWQSAGRTRDPWWGPAVEDVIRELAGIGHPAVVVCSAGFVSDHLETLYDLDIEARAVAEEARIRFVRTRMPNADPAFLEVLAAVVRDHLSDAPAHSAPDSGAPADSTPDAEVPAG
jgi:protoporphyrin/coproporphyrin ferrochelatase